MLGITHFSLFVLSCIALSVTPGPDSAFIVARSVSAGRTAGVVSTLGIITGCCIHLTATVLGLTAILAASVQAFTIIKWVGAAYLVYLGVRMLFAKSDDATAPSDGSMSGDTSRSEATAAAGAHRSLRRVFLQGLGTNLLNPKVVLFFVAFFPQFVGPEAPNKSLAFLLLGGVFIAISLVWNCSLACAAGMLSRRIGASPRAKRLIDKLVGGVFLGLGVRLALITR